MEPIAVSTVSTTSSDSQRRASLVSQRVAAYEQHITQKRRVSDTLEGRRLEELSTSTNSTSVSTSTLSTRTMVDNPTAEEDFEVKISKSNSGGAAESKNSSKGDEALLGTHVSFAEGEDCEASCATSSIADDGEEKLMAAIAAATTRKGQTKHNAAHLFDKIDHQNAKLANEATRALQEVERVLFFTDVIDRNPPKEPTPPSSPSSNKESLVKTGADDRSDVLSPLLKMSAVAMKGVYDTVYKSSVEAYNEVEKTCKEVERTLLFTDLPDAARDAQDTQEEEKTTTVDPREEFCRVLKTLEKTLLFTDLPDDAIYHSKSLPTTTAVATSDTSALGVNSSLSMCHDVHRTLCFTDLEEQRELMLKEQQKRKSNLMSQVLLEDNTASLVSSVDLQRLQERIDEVRRVDLAGAPNEEQEEVSVEEDDSTVSLVSTADLQRFQERIDEVRRVNLAGAPNEEHEEMSVEDDATPLATTNIDEDDEEAEEEKACVPEDDASSMEESIEATPVQENEEQKSEGQRTTVSVNDSNSSDDVRLLVEVSVASSKSVEEIDVLAAPHVATPEKERFKEENADEEDETEELTETQTEESDPADACAARGVSPVYTGVTVATDDYSYGTTEDEVAQPEASVAKGSQKFDVLLAEMKELETVIDSDLERAQTALGKAPEQ